MSDLHDQFEKLARRGTPRGGDDVLSAARSVVDGDAVSAVGMSVDSKPPRQHLGQMIAASGIAATLFVATLAFSAFIGAGSGSDSAEGAVRQLADAVSREDSVAAADVLVPDEVQSLNQTVSTAARRAQELQLARSAAAPLAGLDLSVDGLDLSTETMADGYVKVTVNGGTLSASTDAAQFSPIVQQAVGESNNNTSRTDLASLAKSQELPTFVVAIERDGHWYVSAAYTALEYIREANDLPPADFGSGLRAAATLGAESPDAAVDQGLQALAQNDWEALIALAPPDEIPAYDYRAALTELGRDTTTDFAVASRETHATIDGDTAKVTLKASGTTESGTWSIDGACFKPPIDANVTLNGNQDWCGTPYAFSLLPYFGGNPAVARAGAITTVQRQGRWFISPVGTVLDLVDAWVNQVTQRQMYTLLGAPERLPADATLTLGAPVSPGEAGAGAAVFALEGREGDRVLGILTAPTGFEDSFSEVRVFAPDGTLMLDSFDLVNGTGLRLPVDGTYKLVVMPYGNGQTLTVWDAAQAPDAAKQPPNADMFSGCAPTPNGGTSCSGSSSSSSGSSSSSSSSSGVVEECVTDASGNTVCHTQGSSSSSSSSGSATTPTTMAATATTAPGG